MSANKIPVIVLTGFLGSGKTTLLNRFLADGIRTAVIINEFGTTPVDQDLLQDQNLPLTVLSGGCLCCQVKGALAPTLKNLRMVWERAPIKPFERIIIEASGVASPEPILDTLLREPWIARRYFLQQVIATLAIPSAIEQLQRHAEARAQVVWADTLLLTHADLADAEQQAALAVQLQTLAPATPILPFSLDRFDISALLEYAQPLFRRLPPPDAQPQHNFRSVSLYFDHTPSWPHLQAVLQDLLIKHADSLVRIKGVVYPPEFTEPLIVQAAAGRLYPPAALPLRAGQEKRSRLVLIAVSDIERLADELLAALDSNMGQNSIRLHSR